MDENLDSTLRRLLGMHWQDAWKRGANTEHETQAATGSEDTVDYDA